MSGVHFQVCIFIVRHFKRKREETKKHKKKEIPVTLHDTNGSTFRVSKKDSERPLTTMLMAAKRKRKYEHRRNLKISSFF